MSDEEGNTQKYFDLAVIAGLALLFGLEIADHKTTTQVQTVEAFGQDYRQHMWRVYTEEGRTAAFSTALLREDFPKAVENGIETMVRKGDQVCYRTTEFRGILAQIFYTLTGIESRTHMMELFPRTDDEGAPVVSCE